MPITDLHFQLYSSRLQTLLLLGHREYPCHPPDEKRHIKAKKSQPPISVFPQVE